MMSNRSRIAAATSLALTAAGCTGSDVLTTPNSMVRLEVGLEGQFQQSWDCLVFELDDTWARPLDGVCSASSSNAGDPCLNNTDCEPPGTGVCEGSDASEVIGDQGIGLLLSSESILGNMLGGPCTPTTAGGATCAFPFFPAVPCTMDSECDLSIPNNFCRPTFFAQVSSGEFIQPAPTILSTELYQISALNIRQVALYRDNPALLRRCGTNQEAALALGTPTFTVTQGAEKVVRLTLHVDVLEQVLTGQSSCNAFQAALAQVLTCDTCDDGL